jgi:hypothetical protein
MVFSFLVSKKLYGRRRINPNEALFFKGLFGSSMESDNGL